MKTKIGFKKFVSVVEETNTTSIPNTSNTQTSLFKGKKDDLYEDVTNTLKQIVKEIGIGKVQDILRDIKDDSTNDEKEDTKNLKDLEEAQKLNPIKYLRDLGFRIKNEEPKSYGFEIEMFSKESAKNAFEELKSAGFMDTYDIEVGNKVLYIEEI